MPIGKSLAILAAVCCHLTAMAPQKSFGQAFGVELQASTLLDSGGMGGANICTTPGCANTSGPQPSDAVPV